MIELRKYTEMDAMPNQEYANNRNISR